MIPFFSFQFTFAKMWLLYAQFEIRQKNLPFARKALVSKGREKELLFSCLNRYQS